MQRQNKTVQVTISKQYQDLLLKKELSIKTLSTLSPCAVAFDIFTSLSQYTAGMPTLRNPTLLNMCRLL